MLYFVSSAVSRSVQHRNLLTDSTSGLVLTLVDFGSSVNLYSIIASLTSELVASGENGSGDDVVRAAESRGSSEVFCVMVFIGENEDFVLVSNIAM